MFARGSGKRASGGPEEPGQGALFEEFGEIKSFTTTIGRRVSRDTREQELEALWSKLQSAEAVVTDRLHGMIFAR